VSRISFDPIDAPEPQPTASSQYYNDGTVIVTRQLIILGPPYNQTYPIANLQGVRCAEDTTGMVGRVMWMFLSGFGILFGSVLMFSVDSPVMGGFFICASLAILYKCIRAFGKWYVELMLGGLNNQTLNMKKKEGAENLAYCIRKAMQDLHTPPEPGQPVAYQPVFPDPVLTRN
jgi:hypothetical protein